MISFATIVSPGKLVSSLKQIRKFGISNIKTEKDIDHHYQVKVKRDIISMQDYCHSALD